MYGHFYVLCVTSVFVIQHSLYSLQKHRTAIKLVHFNIHVYTRTRGEILT